MKTILSMLLILSMGCLMTACIAPTNAHFAAENYIDRLSGKVRGYDNFPETLRINLPTDQKWITANSWGYEGKAITEMIPADENIKDWKQLISVKYTSYKVTGPVSVQERMLAHKKSIQKICPNVKWHVFEEQPGEVTYQWQIQGCGTGIRADQIEIARIIKGFYGFNSIHFAVKTRSLSSQMQQKMLETVKSAKLVES